MWSLAEKANLHARLRAGALAVEFSGCSMRPILGCNPRGSYRWQRTTLSSESIEIHNQDELFAKLPLGALALAQTSSSEGLLRETGDFESCKASTDDNP